jgi:hypothetical protein
MKNLLLIVIALSLSACATMAPMSHKEQCALKGMKLHGVSEESGTTHASAHNWRTRQTIDATAFSRSENVVCVVPNDEKEECEIDRIRTAALPKAEYNNEIRAKNLITSAGYFLFIVPGIVAKVAYDAERSKAIEASKAAYEEANTCRYPASKR